MKLSITSQGVFFQLKKKVTPKNPFFLSSPIASKHSGFSFCRSFNFWSAYYPEEICLEKSDFGGHRFETVLGSQAVFMWLHSVRLEIGRKSCERNLQLTCITKSARYICTSLSSMLSFWSLKHVWLKIIWFKSSHNPEW